MLFGSMFYLILFSNLFLKVFGTILDKINSVFKKIFDFIKNNIEKIKLKKKNTEIQQEN